MKNKKVILAWILLIILITILLSLVYIKNFGIYNYQDIEEISSLDNSTDEAIELALSNIVDNFNNNEELNTLKEQNVNLNASLNNHTIFISYTKDTTTTYEFNYHNLNLNITISDDEENLEKFNLIYKILLESIQLRIKNEDNIDALITPHITDNLDLVGIEKNINKENNTINYKIDITRKISKKEGE